MREFYGKALMRKAEALEHLERWKDAGQTWRLVIEAGHGGGTAIQGRNRCDKAAQPQPARAPPTKKPAAVPVKPRSAPSRTVPSGDSEAVARLRAANEAATRADDERFALSDAVEAKLTAWKGGKADNLRALLGSLDTVLWPEAGWKKVGMAELVLPNRVKIAYMKGIAKVHPDKVSFKASFLPRTL